MAIALADVSVNVDSRRNYNPPGGPNRSYQQISFGDATKTYDTYGIPLPADKLGVINEVIFVHIRQLVGRYDYIYDPTVRAANPVAPWGTIRIVDKVTGLEFSGAPAATTLGMCVEWR